MFLLTDWYSSYLKMFVVLNSLKIMVNHFRMIDCITLFQPLCKNKLFFKIKMNSGIY